MTDDKTLEIEFKQLKKNMFSDEWELVKASANRLKEIGNEEVLEFLISLITVDDSNVRNIAALTLKDIKDNRALEPLLSAIFKENNHNYSGTMVFALESLDCSQKFKEIFKILFWGNYESKMSAYTILSEQIFDFTKDDLLEIQQMWIECSQSTSKCPCYDNMEVRQMVQETVDGFMSYLKL